MPWYDLAEGTPRIEVGDVVCLASSSVVLARVTKALPEALASAKAIVGIVTALSPGIQVQVADVGIVPASVTGLGPRGWPPRARGGQVSLVRVNSAARCERVAFPMGGDHIIGICNADGDLTIQPYSEVGTGAPRVLNVRLFGARADATGLPDAAGLGGGTDDSGAFQAAIESLDPLRGGIVEVPFGNYRLAREVLVDRPVIIRGHGGEDTYPATVLYCDAGVTAFRLFPQLVLGQPSPPPPPSGNGAQGAVIEHLAIRAVASAAASVMGSYDMLIFDTVTLDSPGDFRNGQTIRIHGAGQMTPLHNVTASVGPNSPDVAISGYPYGSNGLHVGQYLVIAPAFLNPTMVTGIVYNMDQTIVVGVTMAADSVAAAPAGTAIDVVHDHFAFIRSGGGTTTLKIDLDAQRSVTAAVVSHGDCGIHMLTRATVRHCTIGGGDGGVNGFHQGAAVLIAAGANAPLIANANHWRLEDVGCLYNRYGVVVVGNNVNGGCADQVFCAGQDSWSIIDTSFGNTYVACSMTSGYGIITLATSAHRSVFLGTYVESGTYCAFGLGTNIIGSVGSLPLHPGGYAWTGQVINRVTIGEVEGGAAFSSHRRIFDPTQYFERYRHSTSVVDYDFRKSAAGDGELGWYLHQYMGQPYTFPFGWSDSDATVGPGHFWVPRGFHIGGYTGGPTWLANSIRFDVIDRPDPLSGNPPSGNQGDVLFYRNPESGGKMGLRCVSGGDGVATIAEWKEWGVIDP